MVILRSGKKVFCFEDSKQASESTIEQDEESFDDDETYYTSSSIEEEEDWMDEIFEIPNDIKDDEKLLQNYTKVFSKILIFHKKKKQRKTNENQQHPINSNNFA